MPDMSVSRREAKDLTRRRLLAAALRIIDAEGEAGLSTGRVAREAGVAQATFYGHFRNMDELLRTLGEDARRQLDVTLRDVRRTSREAPGDLDKLRATFRVPLERMVARPELFRLFRRMKLARAASFAEPVTEQSLRNRAGLVEDLVAAGFPHATQRQRRRLEMISDGLIALTETMALGYLEGRFRDLDESVDVLVAFLHGHLPAARRAAEAEADAEAEGDTETRAE